LDSILILSARTIISGIASGTLGVLAALLARRWWETRLLIATSDAQFAASAWKGYYSQEVDGVEMKIPVTADLRAKWKRVHGNFHADAEFKCSGGFFENRILTLHYWVTEPGVLRHGTLMMRLHSDAKRLQGFFVGYGSHTEKLVHGTIYMERCEAPSAGK
jgi:hypothetical protein